MLPAHFRAQFLREYYGAAAGAAREVGVGSAGAGRRGSGELVARLLAEPGGYDLDLDGAAVALCSGPRRLIVGDDLDRGGPDAVAVLAGRVVAVPVAVLVTSQAPLGIGGEVWLGPLSPAAIGAVPGETRHEVRHALWVASRGLPGPARAGGDPRRRRGR